MQDADFSRTTFDGKISFYFSVFEGDVTFARAVFLGPANFQGVQFRKGSAFTEANLNGRTDFRLAHFGGEVNFFRAKFADETSFERTRFSSIAEFRQTVFSGKVSFPAAEMDRGVFIETIVASTLELELSPAGGSALEFVQVGNQPPQLSPTGAPAGPAIIRFGRMSLARTQLRSLDAAEIRLRGSLDLEMLSLFDVKWGEAKGGQVFVADERDLSEGPTTPGAEEEIERIYAGIRKNYERQGDRANAQRWYVAEMEVGRRNARLMSVRRLARAFYKQTSHYGLSAGRAVVLGLAFMLAVFFLYRIPHSQVCPVLDSGRCIGWADDLKVVLMAVCLQDLPEGVKLQGVLSTILWLALKGTGLVVLGSLGVVFWKNVGR